MMLKLGLPKDNSFLDVNHFWYKDTPYEKIINRKMHYYQLKEFYFNNLIWCDKHCKEEVLYHYDDFHDESINIHTFILTFRFHYKPDYVHYILWTSN